MPNNRLMNTIVRNGDPSGEPIGQLLIGGVTISKMKMSMFSQFEEYQKFQKMQKEAAGRRKK
jgi:hypothetical protein